MPYAKKLEGVRRSDDLDKLLAECRQSAKGADAETELTKTQAASMLNEFDSMWNQTLSSSTPTPPAEGDGGKDVLEQAMCVLRSFKNKSDDDDDDDDWLPISVVKAMAVCFARNGNEESSKSLEAALGRTTLVFTPPPKGTGASSQKTRFQQRMDRLRLMNEETQYSKLTKNIGTERPDDITTKSMTYAASVGLNMIVAPLSFGCFMYFFAGSLLDWILGENYKKSPNGTDIKRVIIGVISGVIMLFIEMILFVIRTHEFEKHTRRKELKKQPKPFGHYSKDEVMNRTYLSKPTSNATTMEDKKKGKSQKSD